jgi:hypothetical protein
MNNLDIDQLVDTEISLLDDRISFYQNISKQLSHVSSEFGNRLVDLQKVKHLIADNKPLEAYSLFLDVVSSIVSLNKDLISQLSFTKDAHQD